MTEAETRLTNLVAEVNEITGESDASITDCLKTLTDRYNDNPMSSYTWLKLQAPHSTYVLRPGCKIVHCYNASGLTHGYLALIMWHCGIPNPEYSAKFRIYRKYVDDIELAQHPESEYWISDLETNPGAWYACGNEYTINKDNPSFMQEYRLSTTSTSSYRYKGLVFLAKVTPYNCDLFNTFYKFESTIAPVEST